jgi:putative pyruvate formate lyase activating enzyme
MVCLFQSFGINLVDIYLPDFKYGSDEVAVKYSRLPKYSQIAEEALREMFRQVGHLETDEDGLAKRGVIVRHMVLPDNLENTFLALERIATINKDLRLSLMSQYYPIYKTVDFPEINRPVSLEEAAAAENKKLELGLEYGWTQEPEAGEIFLPDFNKINPFEK